MQNGKLQIFQKQHHDYKTNNNKNPYLKNHINIEILSFLGFGYQIIDRNFKILFSDEIVNQWIKKAEFSLYNYKNQDCNLSETFETGEMSYCHINTSKENVNTEFKISCHPHSFVNGAVETIIVIIKKNENTTLIHDTKSTHSSQDTNCELDSSGKEIKENFLCNISHELRTPIYQVISFAEFIEDEENLSEQGQEFVAIIKNSSENLLGTLTKLIEISKIQANDVAVSTNEFNIEKTIAQLCKRMEDLTNKEIIFDLKKIIRPIVNTDEALFIKIISYLLENSIKFSSNTNLLITIGCYYEENKPVYFVKDNGIGISTQKANLVFEMFRQENESSTKEHGGLGLGLTLANSYVKLLGGEMWFKSSKDKGSTFYFTLKKEELE